jgi:hypothetical protein
MIERGLPGHVKLSEVEIGHTVRYGCGREPLTGKVGFCPPNDDGIVLIVSRDLRMSKVVLHPETEVIDLGRPEEPVKKFRVVVPGVRP